MESREVGVGKIFFSMQEIGSSIWQIKSASDGPNIVVLGGVHGEERTGVEVVKKLRAAFLDKELQIARGTLILILGNEMAIVANQRGTNGYNLNRLFTKEHLSKPAESFYESKRAHELSVFLAKADISLDLHATFCPSPSFLCCANSPRHEKIYRWFKTNFVLTDPNFLVGDKPATTDEFVDAHDGMGICFEAGWMEDNSLINSTYESVINILIDNSVLDLPLPTVPENKYQTFVLTGKIIFTEDSFRYAKEISLESFSPVVRGQVLGFHGNKTILAPDDGVLVFQRAENQLQPGDSIFFFAKKV